MSGQVELRTATLNDAKTLYDWRNDPLTRKNSLNQQEIPFESHQRWLSDVLLDKDRHLLIALDSSGVAVGTGRADFDGKFYELSWSIAPNKRGQGLGQKLVRALTDQFQPAQASIRQDNISSIKIAEAIGFTKVAVTDDGVVLFQLD